MGDDSQKVRGVDGRRQRILNYLLKETAAQVDELAERFGVSRMTVHRDLDALSEQGFVRKVHGGARVQSFTLVETDFAQRGTIATAEKRAIARLAAELVQPGQIIAIDDSSTSTFLAEQLAPISPLTVITNGLGPLERLRGDPGKTVICLGGTYYEHFHAFFGLVCEQAMRGLRANMAFISAQSIWDNTLYHSEEDVAKIKLTMASVATERVLMANSQKFGVTALHRFGDVADFDIIITDCGISAPDLDKLRETKLQIKLADPQQT
ncbi:DeoR/GlpR transcriptional regulator [Acidisoma cellulosilytica]|uniref:DeoR/GlpR transcriptional regulator n=1 Tax=Acidisoma cellulosilyticum TaxID=2802395 RepID=A0A964E2S0_9PROT|nr:DeoR/GlpR family DNA-binding transcription regulator [Acidisoma cellulosilyticum]MCB8879930.1 DeoR/GlpR transcriptional regulator [Acidisoma cellulosilyticum]